MYSNNQIPTLSKDALVSELNAMNYVDHWTGDGKKYIHRLWDEYYKRIEDECKLPQEAL